MASINPEGIVDELRTEFRRALRDAVLEVLPSTSIDEHDLFRAFKKAVRRKCRTWENVRDTHIRI